MGTSTNIPELPDRQRTFHGRLLDAAGVREASLSPSARRTLAWLAAWDEPTIAGLEDLLRAARGTPATATAGGSTSPGPDSDLGFEPTGWSEWDSVACILARVPLLGPKLIRFLDADRHSIDWDGVDAEYPSHGEQLLVDLAHNLWNQGACPSVAELVATLDDDNFALALRAIKIRRRWRGGPELASDGGSL